MLIIELPLPIRFEAVRSNLFFLLGPSLHHLHQINDVPAAL